jgi:hypothetical protein
VLPTRFPLMASRRPKRFPHATGATSPASIGGKYRPEIGKLLLTEVCAASPIKNRSGFSKGSRQAGAFSALARAGISCRARSYHSYLCRRHKPPGEALRGAQAIN